MERDPVLAENGLISIDLARIAGTPKGTRSLTFRLPGLDLFSFAPPPGAVVTVPHEATATAEDSVRVEAPGRTDAKLRLALAAAWREDSAGEPHVRVEAQEIST